MKKKFIAVIATVVVLATLFSVGASAASERWTANNVHAPNYDDVAYSFALVGDTQVLTSYDADTGTGTPVPANRKGHNYVKNIYKWIVDKKEDKKIAYVFGLGDITQNSAWGTSASAVAQRACLEPEWRVAKEAISQLDGVLPYSMVRGNHDNKEKFIETFDTDVYKGQFAGTYKNINNTYRTFDICGEKYLFITIDYAATRDIFNWAGGIIQQHPDRKVIISTHGYMNNNGTLLNQSTNNVWNGSTDAGTGGLVGEYMWDLLIKKYENIFMILCGHFDSDCPQIIPVEGDNGNTVYQVLVNPQGVDIVDPIGTVAMLSFSKDGSTFWVEYYSTVKNKYYDLTPATTGHEQYTNYEFVYSEPRFTATEATTTAEPVPTSTPTYTAATTTTTVDEATGGCGGEVLGIFTALPLIAGCSAVALKKKRKK